MKKKRTKKAAIVVERIRGQVYIFKHGRAKIPGSKYEGKVRYISHESFKQLRAELDLIELLNPDAELGSIDRQARFWGHWVDIDNTDYTPRHTYTQSPTGKWVRRKHGGNS